MFSSIDLIISDEGVSLRQVKDCDKYCKDHLLGGHLKSKALEADAESVENATSQPSDDDGDHTNMVEEPTPRPIRCIVKTIMPVHTRELTNRQSRERSSRLESNLTLHSPLYQHGLDNNYPVNPDQRQVNQLSQHNQASIFKDVEPHGRNMWKENKFPRQYDDYGIETQQEYKMMDDDGFGYRGAEGHWRMPPSPSDGHNRPFSPGHTQPIPGGYFDRYPRHQVHPPHMRHLYGFSDTVEPPRNALPMKAIRKPSLKDRLASEASDRPHVYRGDLNRHSRAGVNPSGFFQAAQLAQPPSSQSLKAPKPAKPQRVPPVGSSVRFENAIAGSSKLPER